MALTVQDETVTKPEARTGDGDASPLLSTRLRTGEQRFGKMQTKIPKESHRGVTVW